MKAILLLGSVVGCPLLVYAQASVDPISGGAGWAGAGLLGAVLAWLLLVHLPGKDKQLQGFVEAKDAQIRGFVAEVAALRLTFTDESEKQRQLFDRKTTELQNMLMSTLQAMRTAVHDVRDTAQVAINKIEVAHTEGKPKG